MQHTVFVVRIEKTLKHKGEAHPSKVKVRQNQGNLPWKTGQDRGLGYRIEGEPMLQIGQRYLLFLWNPYEAQPQAFRGRKYVESTIDGVKGRSGELDELMLVVHGTQAQVLLRNGKAEVPQEQGREAFPNWTYKLGPERTIVGISERDALDLVEKCIRETPQRLRDGG
jgi:hypothetical protein